MNEIVKIWLENFINKEIDDVMNNIENRKIWCSGICDKEALQVQLDNLSLDNEYLTALKTLRNRIENEDI